MSFQNISPCLSQVETSLKQCLSALNTEHPVSVSALSETIGNCAKALSQLQPIINELAKGEESQSFIIACVREYALDLLFSLDETQAAYKPRTHGDNIELIHELLELIDEDEPSPPLASEEMSQAKQLPPEFSEAKTHPTYPLLTILPTHALPLNENIFKPFTGKDKERLPVPLYYLNDANEWIPIQRGFAIEYAQIDSLIKWLEQADRLAKEQGNE